MIKNFICSCVAVNPDLANKDFNTPLQNEQSVMTSPASIASSTPIETNLSTPNGSVGASIKLINKHMVKNIMNSNYFELSGDKATHVYRQLFLFLKNDRGYSELIKETKDIINSMDASLTKLTIEKRLQSESSFPPRQLFITPGRPSGAAADSSPPVSPSNSRSLGDQSSYLEDEVKQLLAKKMPIPTNYTLLETDTKTLIDIMAKDICSKGFFNPETLEDATQKEVAQTLIKNVKSNSVLPRPRDRRSSCLSEHVVPPPPEGNPFNRPVVDSSRSLFHWLLGSSCMG